MIQPGTLVASNIICALRASRVLPDKRPQINFRMRIILLFCCMLWSGAVNAQALTWAPQTKINGVGSLIGPSLASFQGRLFAAWRGIDGDDGIYWSSFDGQGWASQRKINGVGSAIGPTLAEFQGRLFAAWQGIVGDDGIYWSSFDGQTWAPQRKINGVGTSYRPSLASFQNKLVAAWKGVDTSQLNDEKIYWSSFDGNSWTPQQFIGGVASAVGPSLAADTGELYASWRGLIGDEGLYWSKFDGRVWAPQQNIPYTGSLVGPSVVAVGDKLVAAWRGIQLAGGKQPDDDGIYWSSFNGANWATQQKIGGVGSLVGPSLAEFRGRIYAAWRGVGGDDGIWYSVAK